MPIVLIIIGLAVAIGVGSFFLRPEDTVVPITTETPARPEVDGTTVEPETGDDALSNNVPTESGDNPAGAPVAASAQYTNGAHAVNTSYLAPNKANHNVAVTLTLADDIVTATTITFTGDDVDVSKGYQSKFAAAYEAQVIGKKLDDIKLSRVGGASLTSDAFNDAVAKVKAVAQN